MMRILIFRQRVDSQAQYAIVSYTVPGYKVVANAIAGYKPNVVKSKKRVNKQLAARTCGRNLNGKHKFRH